MEKINFMFFFTMLLAISYSKLSEKNLPLNEPRKLQVDQRETILLGFDNYKRNYSNSNTSIYFNIHFLLKNYNETQINNIEYNNIILKGFISYSTNITEATFNCTKESNESFSEYDDDNEKYYHVNYLCNYNLTGTIIPKKINITTNYTEEIDINGTKISYVSSSTEALEKELTSLNYENIKWEILKDAVLLSQSPTSFKIRGKEYDRHDDSENIQLITNVKGNVKKVLCSGKYVQDSTDDKRKFFLESKGTNNLAGADLNYALLNYTKKSSGDYKLLVLDFAEGGKNATILEKKTEKKKSNGLSTGGIIGIIIPSVVLLLGAAGLAFFLSRRAIPPPPMNNIANKTLGVASSEAIVHQ